MQEVQAAWRGDRQSVGADRRHEREGGRDPGGGHGVGLGGGRGVDGRRPNGARRAVGEVSAWSATVSTVPTGAASGAIRTEPAVTPRWPGRSRSSWSPAEARRSWPVRRSSVRRSWPAWRWCALRRRSSARPRWTQRSSGRRTDPHRRRAGAWRPRSPVARCSSHPAPAARWWSPASRRPRSPAVRWRRRPSPRTGRGAPAWWSPPRRRPGRRDRGSSSGPAPRRAPGRRCRQPRSAAVHHGSPAPAVGPAARMGGATNARAGAAVPFVTGSQIY